VLAAAGHEEKTREHAESRRRPTGARFVFFPPPHLEGVSLTGRIGNT
jgi:hypothetical protein